MRKRLRWHPAILLVIAGVIGVGAVTAAVVTGPDDEGGPVEPAAPVVEQPPPSAPPDDRALIERVFEAWAPAFARGKREMCEQMVPGACERYLGEPDRWQRSFADASIERLAITGHTAATATVSNRSRIVLRKRRGSWRISEVRRLDDGDDGQAGSPAAEPEARAPRPTPRERILARLDRRCPDDRAELERMVAQARRDVREEYGAEVSEMNVLLALDRALKGEELRAQITDSCSPVFTAVTAILGLEAG